MHEIYERYPMMKPFVGKRYVPGDPGSLLLIGESHYFPPDSTQHQSAESWYRGNESTLIRMEERSWINTSEIIEGSRAQNFSNKSHSIYRKSFLEINKNGPNYQDYCSVADIVVFYNYFLRPGLTGASLQVVEEDRQIANEVFELVFAEYRPSAIVFLSKLAFRSWMTGPARSISVPFAATPHPGCLHWNRVSASYGGKCGREVLGEFIRSIWHPTDTST